MSDPSEREDLESLLKSPGWLRFTAYAQKEWGAVEVLKRTREAASSADDPAEAVRRVMAAHEAINNLLVWPHQRVQFLQEQDRQAHAAQVPNFSRRGGL